MAHLTLPAEILGVSAGSFPETTAGNRSYKSTDSGHFHHMRSRNEGPFL